MTQIVIKKYKYLIGIFIILCIVSITVSRCLKKENLYLLYNNEIADCQHIDKYEKNKYPLCHKGIYLFEKINNKPLVFIDNLKTLKLTAKKDFFKYSTYSNINIFLVIKKGGMYEVLPVKIFQVLS
ncbi:hypothetical protein [uncultured Polaribacter sp.]|uniref:hypothetical protein n=1 Tax=uncultured Polaribacter sp. TaxID=174711 RepID=UPI002613844B|nr:hypothetical protein [uncultured Polaribacter sp.]